MRWRTSRASSSTPRRRRKRGASDASARAKRGRRRAGARLGQGARDRAREDPRAARARRSSSSATSVIALAAVDKLRAIGKVSPELLDAVIAYLDDGNRWAAERLTREPGWVLGQAMPRGGRQGVRRLPQPGGRAARSTSCGWARRHRAAYAEAEKLHRQLDRYAYGPPADPLHRGRCRPGPRRRRADRVRARHADHLRPRAVPRARQGRGQAHRRGPAQAQGRRGARRRRPRAPARRPPTRGRRRSASATRSCAS